MPAFSVPVPIIVEPSKNVTAPVGVPNPCEPADTTARNVIDCPMIDGLALEVTVTVVLTFLTVCVSNVLVLGLKLESPPYDAIIECVPSKNEELDNVHELPESVQLPRVLVPSMKFTVPVGVPLVLVTFAINVTDWPKTEGFALEVRAVVVLTIGAGVGVGVGIGIGTGIDGGSITEIVFEPELAT